MVFLYVLIIYNLENVSMIEVYGIFSEMWVLKIIFDFSY